MEVAEQPIGKKKGIGETEGDFWEKDSNPAIREE